MTNSGSNAALIKTALIEMAELRGASVEGSRIKTYANVLKDQNPVDVQDALLTISRLPRNEGELAFPDIGTILNTVKVSATARRNRESIQYPKELVRWRCPDCKIKTCGIVSKGDSFPRTCYGVGRLGLPQGICGAVMDEIHRERAN